jgi:hypothetical protein
MTRLEYMRLPKMRRQEIKESIEAKRRLGFIINDDNPLAYVSNGNDQEEDPEFAEPEHLNIAALMRERSA